MLLRAVFDEVVERIQALVCGSIVCWTSPYTYLMYVHHMLLNTACLSRH